MADALAWQAIPPPPPGSEITLSYGALFLIGAMLGPLTIAIGALFVQLVKSLNQRADDFEREMVYYRDQWRQDRDLAEEAVMVAKTASRRVATPGRKPRG